MYMYLAYPREIKLDNGHAIVLKYVRTINTAYANNGWAIDTTRLVHVLVHFMKRMIVLSMACD